MDLQNAFYIIGIIFMSLMLIILLVLVSAVLVIRSKVNAIHAKIDSKLKIFSDIAGKGQETVGKVKHMMGR